LHRFVKSSCPISAGFFKIIPGVVDRIGDSAALSLVDRGGKDNLHCCTMLSTWKVFGFRPMCDSHRPKIGENGCDTTPARIPRIRVSFFLSE
jgi:hypothetical protein